MFYGLLDLPWWGFIVVTLIMTHITIACVTIYLHRHQAHRSLELHPIASHFFRFWLWLTTGMVTKEWAAIHRKHHAKCETIEDPHSPVVLGISTVMWQGAELYRAESRNQETLERFGHGTPDDWLERNLYTPYSAKGIVIMMIIDLLLFGVPGITIWSVQMAWIPFFAAGVVNGLGHYWGYRNIECPDAATNLFPWGILIGGEELHNNHHAYPTSAKLSNRWFEFDIGWLYIRILSILKLAKVKRVAPQASIVSGKGLIDGDTLKAIIANRFHVLTQYSKEVILPVLVQEKDRLSLLGKFTFRKAKAALVRETSLLDETDQVQIENLLQQNKSLEVVYQFRKRLQEIWGRTTANQKELIDALHEWCQQAERTGIKKLQDFTRYLKGYSLNGKAQ
ncbi:MAG: fatty acid desaturase [Francisellaceae bacterium]|nr:fatty acid desaturase [Francisellaceae bacterium]